MAFTKAVLKKQMDVSEEGEVVEVIDLRLQYEVFPGESYEDVRSRFLKRADKRFTEMFAAELGLMPARIAEGERWKQQGMFDDSSF